jgi:glycosyltransferase involved in cell wall biosynthesis
MPRVTVLIPGHNAEAHLVEALGSILNQTYDDYSILFVDDGSTDATAEIVARFAGPRLKSVRQENQGIVGALNHGLSLIDSEWVARFDADDISLPHRLTSQLEFAGFVNAQAVSSAPIHIDEVGALIGHSAATDPYQPDPTRIPAAEPYLPHPFLLMKRHLFEMAGGYRPAHYSEDADLYWRVCDHCRMAVQRDPLGAYRIHGGSVSTTSLAHIRVQAFFGQLAALNYQRRRAGRDEIGYPGTAAEWVARATNLDTLFAAFAALLDPVELAWIKPATCAKLLIQASWRGLDMPAAERRHCARSVLKSPNLHDKDRLAIQGALSGLTQMKAQLFPNPGSERRGFLSRLLRRG